MLPLKDSRPSKTFPFWIAFIIAVNIWVFFKELLAPDPDAFITQYALIPTSLNFSNLISLTPLITSQFIHSGFIHILSNMWFLWIFGGNVEEKLGFLFFPIFYLLAGIAGGLLQYAIVPDSTLPMLGASGAIAGVLGAYFALFPKHTISTLVPIFIFPAIIQIPAAIILFYWFFTQLFSGTASLATYTASLGGVAFFAHIGGFLTGWFIGQYIKAGK